MTSPRGMQRLRVGRFYRPATTEEYVALQIARLVGGIECIHRCHDLAKRFQPSVLASAFRRMVAKAVPRNNWLEHLEQVLANLDVSELVPESSVLGLRVERRAVAIALLRNGSPDRAQVRELSSSFEVASRSVVRFVQLATEKFPDSSVAFEEPKDALDNRREALARLIAAELKRIGRTTTTVAANQLLEAYAYPPCRTRVQLRNAIRRIWPAVAKRERSIVLDAVAVGFYAHCGSLFVK